MAIYTKEHGALFRAGIADGFMYRNEKTGELETLRERFRRIYAENSEQWAEVFKEPT